MIYSGKSDIGRKRASNQDSFSITKPAEGILLCVICDGMGGMRGGNVASELAIGRFVAEVGAWFKERKTRPGDLAAVANSGSKTGRPDLAGLSDGDFTALLKRSADKANKAVLRRAKREPGLYGMGTTLVAAMFVGDKMYVANIGDSRLYLISEGNGGSSESEAPTAEFEAVNVERAAGEPFESATNGAVINGAAADGAAKPQIKRVTRDHSYVQYLMDMGQLTPDEAERSPYRNAITRAVGKEDSLETDTFIINLPSAGNAYVLMCSDGLYNFLSEEEAARIVLDGGFPNDAEPKEQKRRLDEKVGRLVLAANENGGGDNITALLILPLPDDRAAP